ncbi:AAA family ATPase [Dongia sp.]|uniref:AAA family ATPase n=1 Tax=Dongia sp. TaxID=1977262 RepID=UPI003753B3F2
MTSEAVAFPMIGHWPKAEYRTEALTAYQGNPFIEALPPRQTALEWASRIKSEVAYDASYVGLPTVDRIDFVSLLRNVLFPLDWHLDFAAALHRLIREGYLARNPMDRGFLPQIAAYGSPNASPPGSRSTLFGTPGSYGLIGQSGVGKSKVIRSILRYFPQVIAHTDYNGQPFSWKQLTWLHIDCPPDASLANFGIKVLEQADLALGTNYLTSFVGTRSKERLQISMAKVAALQGLGVLVIDQVNVLNNVDIGVRRRFLDFVAEFNNHLGVPVVLVGNDDGRKVLTEDFGTALRYTGVGATDVPTLSIDDFELILSELWSYRILRQAGELTSEITRLFHDLCGANPDLCCKLYQLSTRRALSLGEESLSCELVKHVYGEYFSLIKLALAAIAQGRPSGPVRFNAAMTSPEFAAAISRGFQQPSISGVWTTGSTITPTARLIDESRLPSSSDGIPSRELPKTKIIKPSQCALVNVVRDGRAKGLGAYESLKAAGLVYRWPSS